MDREHLPSRSESFRPLSSGRCITTRRHWYRLARKSTATFSSARFASAGIRSERQRVGPRVRRGQASRRHQKTEGARAACPILRKRSRAGSFRTRGCVRLPMLLREHGVLGQDSWLPMMLIRYRRDRFIEPLSRVARQPRCRHRGRRGQLAVSVVRRFVAARNRRARGERNGRRLPPALQSLLQLGLHKQSFSKFLAVYSHMTRRAF